MVEVQTTEKNIVISKPRSKTESTKLFLTYEELPELLQKLSETKEKRISELQSQLEALSQA